MPPKRSAWTAAVTSDFAKRIRRAAPYPAALPISQCRCACMHNRLRRLLQIRKNVRLGAPRFRLARCARVHSCAHRRKRLWEVDLASRDRRRAKAQSRCMRQRACSTSGSPATRLQRAVCMRHRARGACRMAARLRIRRRRCRRHCSGVRPRRAPIESSLRSIGRPAAAARSSEATAHEAVAAAARRTHERSRPANKMSGNESDSRASTCRRNGRHGNA